MTDLLWNNRITDSNEIQSSYMFHRTDKSIVKKILSNGFDPTYGPKDEKKDEIFLKSVADEEDAYYPIDRMMSSFCYPHYDQVHGSFGGHLRSGLVVVDSSKVSKPMYVADMDLYDSVISYAPRDLSKIEKRQFTDEQRAVALSYLETITKIRRVNGSTGSSFVQPEVIIEGSISNSAVVGVIMDEID